MVGATAADLLFLSGESDGAISWLQVLIGALPLVVLASWIGYRWTKRLSSISSSARQRPPLHGGSTSNAQLGSCSTTSSTSRGLIGGRSGGGRSRGGASAESERSRFL